MWCGVSMVLLCVGWGVERLIIVKTGEGEDRASSLLNLLTPPSCSYPVPYIPLSYTLSLTNSFRLYICILPLHYCFPLGCFSYIGYLTLTACSESLVRLLAALQLICNMYKLEHISPPRLFM